MALPDELMQAAIEKTRLGIANGQSPFGCAIARDGEMVAVCHNVVWDAIDITAHAEVTALREACRVTKSVLLEACIVATTCEPCPMCMSALHWARVKEVHFGATIADAARAGFSELTISAADVVRLGGSQVKVVPSALREQCVALFEEWRQRGGRSY